MQNAVKIEKGNSQDKIREESPDAAAKISLEFHNFIEDMEDLVKASTSLTGDDLIKLKVQMSDLIASGKKSVDGVRIDLKHRAQKTAAATNTYAHEKPWQAIGIGATTGLLLGFLLARRS